MPIIKSAKKRVKTAQRANVRNAHTKRSLRVAIKNLQTALSSDGKNTSKALGEVQSALDQSVKKGLIHKNKANRRKKQFAAQVKNSGTKVQKAATKKTSTKKPAAKSTSKTK
jgi:small subunit ribosomal protein S20